MPPPDPAVLLPPSWSTELCGPWGWNRRDRQGRGKGPSDVACSVGTQSWHPWVCQLPRVPTLSFPSSCLFSLFVAASSEFPFGAPLTQLPPWGSASPLADHLWPFLGSWVSCTTPPHHPGCPLVPRNCVLASPPPSVGLPFAPSAVPVSYCSPRLVCRLEV